MTSERYEVEVVKGEWQNAEDGPLNVLRSSFRDLRDATQSFYAQIPTLFEVEYGYVYLHDLVAGTTLAVWQNDPDEDFNKVEYDPKD
jgi:hypothetical protein